jgi:hypothetical protein
MLYLTCVLLPFTQRGTGGGEGGGGGGGEGLGVRVGVGVGSGVTEESSAAKTAGAAINTTNKQRIRIIEVFFICIISSLIHRT